MDGPSPARGPQFACLVCRSRKVKCDKAPSGCSRCRRVGVQCPGYASYDAQRASEEIDGVYKRAGIERRKAGACQECRTAKAKCSQTKPRCRRCQMKGLGCRYSGLSSPGSKDEPLLFASQGVPSQLQQPVEDSTPGLAQVVADIPVTTRSPKDVSHQWLYESTLPETTGMRILADSYFTHVHTLRNLGFIYKPAFLKSIDQKTSEVEFGEAVVYLVCALGARYMQVPRTSSNNSSNVDIPGRRWGRRAKRLVRMNACIPSVENLMSLVLYAEYGLRTGDNAFVYMLVGCCTRMSRLLRLDVENGRSDSLITAPKELTKREIKRRLLWSCYVLDSFVGAGVDSNLSWIADIPHIPLACSDKDFILQIKSPPVYAEVDKDLDTLTPTDLRGNISRMIYARTQILRHIRNYNAEIEQPPWDKNSTFLRLLKIVVTWYKHLPDFLAFNDINIYIHQEQRTLGAFYFLHIAYNACVCDLTRVTLPGYNFPLSAALSGAPEDFITEYRQEAWYRASDVSKLLMSALQSGTEGLDDHFTATAAFESTKIQVIYLTTVANGDSRLYAQGLGNINTNLRVLTLTHPYSDMPNVYLSAICPFLHRFGFSDVANHWQPFQNTVLYAPTQPADATQNSEVVGPMESAYLNQIATFRLARREVTDEERKNGNGNRTPWRLFPSAPPSPHPERARLTGPPPQPPVIQPQYQETGLQMLALAGQSQPDAVPSHMPPLIVQDLVQDSGTAESLQLDQEQYLRMAEEISEYMTWDASLPSQFDFPMEDYFSTPGQIE